MLSGMSKMACFQDFLAEKQGYKILHGYVRRDMDTVSLLLASLVIHTLLKDGGKWP
jgi:hypothetical protein